MLQSSSNAVYKLPPSVTDTLKHSISKLEAKIDSLQKITERAEIGKDFFGNVIDQNLQTYVVIIGLLALVSWGFITRALAYHKKTIEKNQNIKFNEFVNSINSKINYIEDEIDVNAYDVNRAMYSKVTKDEDWANSFDWALACAYRLSNQKEKNLIDEKGIQIWLETSEDSLNKVQIGDSILYESIDRIAQSLKSISDLNEEKFKDICTNILKRVNHIVHTIPQPPEDFVERPEDNPRTK